SRRTRLLLHGKSKKRSLTWWRIKLNKRAGLLFPVLADLIRHLILNGIRAISMRLRVKARNDMEGGRCNRERQPAMTWKKADPTYI
ncbi:hypothetical protein, partial [Parabacteroides bouchesdurhonensis]|uniref:hypothetical protein n=1 Tax=Parabacteroides bouchesdurhonensis TaxID=1936995 RepID=UPI0022E97738